MARLILSALLTGIKGTYSGSTFQDWKGIQVLRRTPLGSPYISEYKAFAMGIFSTLSCCFYSLSSAQQTEWDEYADLASTVMSGFDAFIKLNVSLLATTNVNLPLNVTAPELHVKPDTPTAVSARYSQTKQQFIFNWASPSGVTTFMTSFRAIQTGYSNWKSPKWRAGVTVSSSYNRCYFDVSEYPDGQVFRFRGRSIFQNGIVSSNSMRVTAVKSNVYSYPPWIYITDSYYDTVTKFSNINFSYVNDRKQVSAPTDNLYNPSGICTDEDFLFVCDSDNHRIVVFYKDDLSYVAKFGSEGTGDNNFDCPTGICCDDTYLYICDTNNCRIKKHLKSDLSYVDQHGESGAGYEDFNLPKGICIYGGYLYITDSLNNRICIYTCSIFEQEENFGTTGIGDLNFDTPIGITTDGTYLYIVDSGNDRIKKHLISDYSFVSEAGSNGSGDDNFDAPYGIAIDDTYIYIADSANSRVIIRAISSLSFVDEIIYYSGFPWALTTPTGICTMTLHP